MFRSVDNKCEWQKRVEWAYILWTTCIREIKEWNRIVLDIMACNCFGWRRLFLGVTLKISVAEATYGRMYLWQIRHTKI